MLMMLCFWMVTFDKAPPRNGTAPRCHSHQLSGQRGHNPQTLFEARNLAPSENSGRGSPDAQLNVTHTHTHTHTHVCVCVRESASVCLQVCSACLSGCVFTCVFCLCVCVRARGRAPIIVLRDILYGSLCICCRVLSCTCRCQNDKQCQNFNSPGERTPQQGSLTP